MESKRSAFESPWLPGAALLIVAGVLLWRIAMPGQPAGAGPGEAGAHRLQLDRLEQANQSLRVDIARLRDATPGAIAGCPPGMVRRTPQGALLLPDGGAVALRRSAPQGPDSPADARRPQSDPTPERPGSSNGPPAAEGDAAVQKQPGNPPAAGSALAVLDNAALVDRLEKATAIVVAGNATGTGFFIGPALMITNRHVVEHAPDHSVTIASRSLGLRRRGTVLRMTSDARVGDPDFALVRLDDGTAPGWLDLSTHARKLEAIVAAGYPALAVQDDPGFRRLLAGDGTAAPDLNLTQGIVQSMRTEEANGLPLVMHTATILPGNSGGPLVDGCGRVIGVNTFFTQDKDRFGKLSYALGAQAVLRFLQATGGDTREDGRDCG